MSYTKNHDPWGLSDLITTTVLNNFETIYTEGNTYLSTHTHDSIYYTKSEMISKFWCTENDGPGSGADADLIYCASGNLHASDVAGAGISNGFVAIWSGAIVDIPSGWHLCDGAGGTIDLRDMFVVGAGTTAPGTHSTSKNFIALGDIDIAVHQLTLDELAPHTHIFYDETTWQDNSYYLSGTSGSRLAATYAVNSGTSGSSGGNGSHGHSEAEGTVFAGTETEMLPFYYALAFIQKV